jgi:hypothetical protein
MRKLKLIIPTGLALLASPALADTPDDIVDLLGARAPGAETQMQTRGYADVGGNNIWWNAKTGVCVKVHVSQGRYKTIDMLPDGDCGMKAMEESDAAAPGEPSKAAVDACMNSADEYQEEPDGSSVMKRQAVGRELGADHGHRRRQLALHGDRRRRRHRHGPVGGPRLAIRNAPRRCADFGASAHLSAAMAGRFDGRSTPRRLGHGHLAERDRGR